MIAADEVPDLLRELSPRVLGVLVRRHGQFDACEDAVQEALLAAAVDWPAHGRPANPTGWLVTTATRRLIETWRSESARRRREERSAAAWPTDPGLVPETDDTLTLFLLCCHPELTRPAQIAMTLRAVGGLTTAEIARGLLVPEATVGQRISRAKAKIRESGAAFGDLDDAEQEARLPAVLHVLYLIFNEGYAASSGPAVHRVELTEEALRLTRMLHARRPDHGELTGLLALMLLTDARRPARTTADGALVPLAEQDRSRWRRDVIAEGIALLTPALATAVPGPYQVQAAIAAVHDEATTADETDWRQILGLYDVLALLAPGPMVTLNRIVARAAVHGPAAALAELDTAAASDATLRGHFRVDAVRGHLLEQTERWAEARAHYQRAARRSLSLPEQRHLRKRAAAAGLAAEM